MPVLVILLIVVGIVVYYLLVLRRYNSLGFRLFSVFAMLSIMMGWWIRGDEKRLASIADHGSRITATIVSKEKVKSGAPNEVTVSWKDVSGSQVIKPTSTYVSDPEWESFVVNAPLEVVYDQTSSEVYVAQSLERFRGDKWILYAVVGFFFLIGCGCWFFLRKYMVGVDDQGNEWVEKDGKVMLDERQSPAAQAWKRGNILWKLLHLLGGK